MDLSTSTSAPAPAPAPVAPAPAPAAVAAPAKPAGAGLLGVAAPGSDQGGAALDQLRESDEAFSARFGIAELLGETPAAESGAAADPVATGEQPRNAAGQFTRRADPGSVEAAQDAAVASALEPAPGADPATAAAGTEDGGEVEGGGGEEVDPAAAPEPARKLATDFTVVQDGAEVEAPLDALFKFTANGKAYELPVDKVVRLAKMGVYNEEKEQQFTQTAERNQQLETFARELFNSSAQTEQFLALVLAGGEQADAVLDAARAKFAEENSPEAENRRLKAQIEALKQAGPQDGQTANAPARQAALHVAAQLTPQLDALIAQHASTIPAAEVWTRFDKLVAPYKDAAGQLDPRHYDRVLELASTALPVLLETLAEDRTTRATQTRTTQQELAVTKGKLRMAKRQVATGAKPMTGTPAPGSRTTAPARKPAPTNASPETVNETFLETLAQELVGGAMPGA